VQAFVLGAAGQAQYGVGGQQGARQEAQAAVARLGSAHPDIVTHRRGDRVAVLLPGYGELEG
jgi:hypothetical protein